MSKVMAKIEKMNITMPDSKNHDGIITGTFTCPATQANIIDLKQMGNVQVVIEATQPELFGTEGVS